MLTVKLSAQDSFSDFIIRKFYISKSNPENTTSETGFTVTQIQYLKWPEHNVPRCTTSILEIANLVQKVQISTGNKAIVVMCK